MITRRPRGTLLLPSPRARAGERIGLMGGSFNPAHEGHALVAETALRRLRLDRLWWLVTPGNPNKLHDGLVPMAERLARARHFATDPRMVVTGFERELGNAYTAVTIAFLKRRFPRTHFVWVMGADSLALFHDWRDWRQILRAVPVAVVDRPGWHLAALSSPASRLLARTRLTEARAAALSHRRPPSLVVLHGPLSRRSSTEIRRKRLES
jgi:nicotinate-nucleotide adenylyltransferase